MMILFLFCFPLSKILISMFYVEITNEEIEHINTLLQGLQFTCFDIQPRRGTLSSFPWNSLSLSSIFVHCGRLLETRTFNEFIPKHSDMMELVSTVD